MIGFFRSLFDKQSTIDTAVKGIYNGIDMAIYTDEEKSEAAIKRLDAYLKYLESTNSQNIARRFIAMVVVLLWTMLVIVTTGIGLYTAEDKTQFMLTMVDGVGIQVSLVMSFYFGKQLINMLKK